MACQCLNPPALRSTWRLDSRATASKVQPSWNSDVILSSSGCQFGFNLSQYLHQMNHLGHLEHGFDAVAIEISEGSFVEQLGIHDAARGEMVDNKVEEFELIGGEPAAFEEFREGALGGLPVE